MTYANIPGRTPMIWIYDAWIASNPRQGAIVVEIGVALGKSLAYLCERLDAAGRDDVQVYAVDPWAGTHRNGEQQAEADAAGGDFTLYARYMLENAPRAFERVRVIRADECDAVDVFPVWPNLVVLDAEHTRSAVTAQIGRWHNPLQVSTWIGGDDHCPDFPGVEQACREAFGEPGTAEDVAAGRAGYEYRSHGGPWDNPRQYEWGTWLKRGQ